MVFSWSLLLLFFVAFSASLTSADQREWTLEEFKKNVIEDDRVWLVEFYSGMCGSCKEFAPTWDRIEMSLNDVLKTKVNIDQKGGMEVAKYMGALEEGLPNVRLGELFHYSLFCAPPYSHAAHSQSHVFLITLLFLFLHAFKITLRSLYTSPPSLLKLFFILTSSDNQEW